MTELPKPSSNTAEIIEWISGCIAFCISWIYFVNKYFKTKSEEKKEFIENVVIATVKATLDSELKGIKDNIDKLFKYREDDRSHFDGKVDTIIREIRK